MPNRSLNILIVEDHFDTAEILSIELGRLGHIATIVGDCARALQAVRQSQFDLVFCDIGLPDGDGCDLFQQLNQVRTICGIALTGFCMPHEIQRHQSAGFLHYLEKPFNLGDIGKAIDRVIEDDHPCLPKIPDSGVPGQLPPS